MTMYGTENTKFQYLKRTMYGAEQQLATVFPLLTQKRIIYQVLEFGIISKHKLDTNLNTQSHQYEPYHIFYCRTCLIFNKHG